MLQYGALVATGQGVTVALLDSGVNTDLPDFRRCPTGYTGDPRGCPSVVTTVRVHNYRDDSGSVKETDLLRGLQWIYTHHFDSSGSVLSWNQRTYLRKSRSGWPPGGSAAEAELDGSAALRIARIGGQARPG